MLKKVTSTLLFLGPAFAVCAQSDFLGLPVSGYLDNVSDSAALQRNAPYVPLAAMGAQKDDERFWIKRRLSLNYAYAETGFDGNSENACMHSVVPELYLESRAGQSLNLAPFYSSTTEDFSIGDTDTDTYGISLQSAQELWRFLRPGDASSQLWLGFGIGYRNMDTDLTLPQGTAEIEGDGYFISPNLVYAREITKRLTALLVPAYTMEWASIDFGGSDLDTEAGVFSLTGRGDYGVTDRIILTAFATWKQDVHMDVDGLSSGNLDCHSWAEFGGGVRMSITEDIGLRAGYSYEAFHPDFDQHKFLARLELGF